MGEPGFLLGTLYVEAPGTPGVLVEAEVFYRNSLRDTDAQEGFYPGDMASVPETMPDYFWEPHEFYSVTAPAMPNRLLTAHYRDYAQKHPALRRPYRVTMVVEYIETHPEIEALPDANLRQRIYADLQNSDYSLMPVHIDRYQADPNYSAAQEMRDNYQKTFGGSTGAWHDNLDNLVYPNPKQS